MSNIYLVGFMATGKTETARLLAQELRLEFVDMDGLIVKREKMPIARIFQEKGEPYFRQLEKDIVRELSAKDGLVVACGGGAFIDAENIKRLKESGAVFCLTSSPEMILKRTAGSKIRPLLNVGDPKARIAELLEKRRPFYSQAHFTIDADHLTVSQTAQAVLKLLKTR